MKEKNCSNCGASFSCGAEEDGMRCWCVELPALPEAPIAGRDCLCPACLTDSIQRSVYSFRGAREHALDSVGVSVEPKVNVTRAGLDQQGLLVEGEDYYSEGGLIVFTASYHRRRGYCCESDCRHCPYKQQPLEK